MFLEINEKFVDVENDEQNKHDFFVWQNLFQSWVKAQIKISINNQM